MEMEEFFEIMDVKNEFLTNVGSQYQASYSPQQLDIALYLLNDFCNNISANGLVLLRTEPQPPPRQLPPQGYQEPYPQTPYARQAQMQSPRMVARPQPMPMQRPQPMQNPFNEYDEEVYDVQQQVQELNRGIKPMARLQRPMDVPMQPPATRQSDVDLQAEKPKSFVDKIKDMRTPKRMDKINPEEE